MTPKVILYQLCTRINQGTPETPRWEEVFFPVKLGWNEENEEIARREAYNGQYEIAEVEREEESVRETRIAELEEALDLLLSGVME